MNKTYKVLIVDDDPLARRIYAKILTSKGYTVTTFDTAFDISKTVSEHTPDIILIDYQMPIVSGIDAIRQLKSNQLHQSIPIILFSSVPNLALLAKEAGADAYVSKSSAHKDLLSVFEGIVAKLANAECMVER